MPTDITAPRALEKCWTCRRRRLKCDATIPACRRCITSGLECPGYGKPLKWIGGVASRGSMKNATYDLGPTPPRPREKRQPKAARDLTVLEYDPAQKCRSLSPCSSKSSLSATASPPTQLTDPIFQDMGYDARYLLHYFDRKICPIFTISDEARSAYRELMPLVGASEGVASAMMALAALHAVHESLDSPVLLSFALQKQDSIVNNAHFGESRLNNLQSQLLQHCISHKQRALQLLSMALQDPNPQNEFETLGTALVLAAMECFESGAGSWAIHLQGAKKLLEAGIQKSSTLEALTEELMLFDIFGSTFVPPSVVSTSTTMRTLLTTILETRLILDNSFMCPVEMLQLITSVTVKSRNAHEAMSNPSNTSDCNSAVEDLKLDLVKIQQFDISAWAEKVIPTTRYLAGLSQDTVAQMGLIWKLAAAIYVSRLLYNFTKDAQYHSPIADDLITAFIPIKGIALVKFLTWPVVIAGVFSTRPAHRTWTLSTLDDIWRLTFCANVKGAAIVLSKLWEMKDARFCEAGGGYKDWDWLYDISSLDGHWLLF